MKLEHIAINVPDPVAMAAWYVEHMDMKVVIATDSPPIYPTIPLFHQQCYILPLMQTIWQTLANV